MVRDKGGKTEREEENSKACVQGAVRSQLSWGGGRGRNSLKSRWIFKKEGSPSQSGLVC